jgi:DNA-binding transcriptional LysR family regulator
MVSLDDLRFFDALGRSRSLAEAARTLNVSPPAVSVRLRRLEERLAVALVVRKPRGVTLTDAGNRLVQEAAQLLGQLEGVGQRVSKAASALEGPLRVTAPFGFGRRFIAPLIDAFTALHPAVAPMLRLSETPMRDGSASDVVVHIGKMRDSSWVAHRLGANARWLAASPQYVHHHKQLSHPRELATHRCLCLRENDEDLSLWRLRPTSHKGTAAEAAVQVRVRPAMLTNDGESLCGWAEQGQGVILRSQWDLEPRIAAGTLVRVLPGWDGNQADVFALLPSSRGQSARAVEFVRFAQERLTTASSSTRSRR